MKSKTLGITSLKLFFVCYLLSFVFVSNFIVVLWFNFHDVSKLNICGSIYCCLLCVLIKNKCSFSLNPRQILTAWSFAVLSLFSKTGQSMCIFFQLSTNTKLINLMLGILLFDILTKHKYTKRFTENVLLYFHFFTDPKKKYFGFLINAIFYF